MIAATYFLYKWSNLENKSCYLFNNRDDVMKRIEKNWTKNVPEYLKEYLVFNLDKNIDNVYVEGDNKYVGIWLLKEIPDEIQEKGFRVC